MTTHITRQQAVDLLKKYNQEPFHILHAKYSTTDCRIKKVFLKENDCMYFFERLY